MLAERVGLRISSTTTPKAAGARFAWDGGKILLTGLVSKRVMLPDRHCEQTAFKARTCRSPFPFPVSGHPQLLHQANGMGASWSSQWPPNDLLVHEDILQQVGGRSFDILWSVAIAHACYPQ